MCDWPAEQHRPQHSITWHTGLSTARRNGRKREHPPLVASAAYSSGEQQSMAQHGPAQHVPAQHVPASLPEPVASAAYSSGEQAEAAMCSTTAGPAEADAGAGRVSCAMQFSRSISHMLTRSAERQGGKQGFRKGWERVLGECSMSHMFILQRSMRLGGAEAGHKGWREC